MKVRVPLPLPNKANQYEVHFNPVFWKEIRSIVEGLKRYIKGPLYWIGPNKETKDTELAIAYIAKKSLLKDTIGPVRVEIWISDRLDADGIKACLDGIQLSGRIKNDRQVQELIVRKLRMKNEWFEFDITPILGADSTPVAQGEAEDAEQGKL